MKSTDPKPTSPNRSAKQLLASVAQKVATKLCAWSSQLDPSVRSLDHQFRLYQRAVEQCPVSIVITDQQGIIQYVNPSFERLTGYTSEEAFGKSPSILNARTQPAETYIQLWDTIKAGKTWRGELHNVKRNGEAFWEMATISPLKDIAGNITNFVAVKEDISKQRAHNHELEEAYQKAKSADLAKSAFLATMSHELRTPLNTIIGLAALLQESETLGQNAERSMGYIQRSGEQLLGMIENLLQLSKLQNDQSQASVSSFELLPLLCEVAQSSCSQAAEKGIELQVNFDPDLPAEIESEPNHLRQSLCNLLSNAVKYTECGYVRLVASRGKDDTIIFSVIDSGLGISKENQANIFDAFYQIDGSNTNGHGGAGLGLAICQSFAKRLGGELSVESEIGRGSKFSLKMPMKSPDTEKSLYSVLSKPELEGITIAALLQPSLFLSNLQRLAKACNWELILLPSHELDPSDIPAHTNIIIAESESREELADTTNAIPTIWRNQHNAPNRADSIVPNPLPDQLLATVIDALSKRSNSDSSSAAAKKQNAPKLAETLPLNIIVADDIASNRTVAKLILKHLGYQPTLVSGGIPFIEAIRRERFDLALLDLQMPDLDGLSAFRELNANPPETGMPLVAALTADSQDNTRKLCMNEGMAGYLTKPINPKKITDCIHTLFAKQCAPEAREDETQIDEDALLDREHLDVLLSPFSPSDAAEMIEQLWQAFETDMAVNLESAKQFCMERQVEKLIPVVHGLKGGFQTIGWMQAGKLSQSLLDQLRSGSFEAFDDLPRLLEEVISESTTEMKKYLKEIRETPVV